MNTGLDKALPIQYIEKVYGEKKYFVLGRLHCYYGSGQNQIQKSILNIHNCSSKISIWLYERMYLQKILTFKSEVNTYWTFICFIEIWVLYSCNFIIL